MRIEDQPAPIERTDRAPVWPMVIEDFKRIAHVIDGLAGDPVISQVEADMLERDRTGRERYGVPLTAGNGRDHLVDAYQEKLDAAAYLCTWLEEHQSFADRSARLRWITVRNLYTDTLRSLVRLRWIMGGGS